MQKIKHNCKGAPRVRRPSFLPLPRLAGKFFSANVCVFLRMVRKKGAFCAKNCVRMRADPPYLVAVYFAKNFTNFSYFSFSFFWKIIYSRPRPPKSCLPLAEIVQNDLFCGPFFPAFPDLQKVLRRNPGRDRIFTHICINYK